MTAVHGFKVLLFLLPIIRGRQCTSNGLLLQSQFRTTKLSVSIYYEGLCPDSRKFITEVFYPQYKLFADYLDVKFVPFGKASINDDGSDYECQHGKEECIRNIIHGCALDVLPPGEQQVDFVYCAMINKSITGQEECVKQRGLDWNTVKGCTSGTRGLELTLQAQYDTRVSTGGPKFVPTIIFNNQFSQEDQDKAFLNFAEVLCTKYLVGIPQCITTY